MTTPEFWLAFAGLVATIAFSAIGLGMKAANNRNLIIEKINANKGELEDDLSAMRIAAYEEYKLLRKEIESTSSQAYREFGESLMAIREKVVQIELWIRDELKDTRHSLQGSMDMRYQILKQEIDRVDERVRKMEIELAKEMTLRHPTPH